MYSTISDTLSSNEYRYIYLAYDIILKKISNLTWEKEIKAKM